MNLKHLIFIHFSKIFESSHMSFHLKIILFIRVTEIRDIHVSFVDHRSLVYGQSSLWNIMTPFHYIYNGHYLQRWARCRPYSLVLMKLTKDSSSFPDSFRTITTASVCTPLMLTWTPGKSVAQRVKLSIHVLWVTFTQTLSMIYCKLYDLVAGYLCMCNVYTYKDIL